MHKIYFYVPKSHAELVKAAAFSAGAGHIGHYDMCAWESEGQGQFRPLAGSDPFLGTVGQVEKSVELKVEMVCADKDVQAVLRQLLAAHPYETPAYGAYKIKTLDDFALRGFAKARLANQKL